MPSSYSEYAFAALHHLPHVFVTEKVLKKLKDNYATGRACSFNKVDQIPGCSEETTFYLKRSLDSLEESHWRFKVTKVEGLQGGTHHLLTEVLKYPRRQVAATADVWLYLDERELTPESQFMRVELPRGVPDDTEFFELRLKPMEIMSLLDCTLEVSGDGKLTLITGLKPAKGNVLGYYEGRYYKHCPEKHSIQAEAML